MIADLVAFLAARLAEDEQAQRDQDEAWHATSCGAVPTRWRSEIGDCDCGIPARVLADVAAKFRLVDAYLTTKAEQDAIATCMTEALTAGDVPDREDAGAWRKAEARLEALDFPLRLAALPFWDHLHYDESWKP